MTISMILALKDGAPLSIACDTPVRDAIAIMA